MRHLHALTFLALLTACKTEEPPDTDPPPCADADADGVCDEDDACPGFDDAIDGDGDGVADGCDPCPLDAPDDADGDGVCDSEDACAGHADGDDADGDGVPDGCDACEGHDDGDDADGDGVPDGCDACEGHDDAADEDGDGVPDGCDVCEGHDDAADGDGDGVPDGCDACPQDAPDDTDGDGVCDSLDVCEGHDDAADGDGDGVPDGCDACPQDAPDDTDGDGVCDSLDVCPGTDDDLDADLDGTPDGCACAVVEADVPEGNPTEPMTAEGGFSFAIEGILTEDTIEDFVFDGVERSAIARFHFYAVGGISCSIWWDLSAPGAVSPHAGDWVAQAPVPMYGAWDLQLTNGQTDCNDPFVTLIQSNLEARPFTVGIGQMLDLDLKLRQDPVVDAEWATEWEPYVSSFYLDGNILFVNDAHLESGYAFGYDRTCGVLKQDPHTFDRVRLPKPLAGPLLEYYEVTPVPW